MARVDEMRSQGVAIREETHTGRIGNVGHSIVVQGDRKASLASKRRGLPLNHWLG